MKLDIVKIGNSRGLRLPKAVIEQCGFERAVELKVRGGSLVITPAATVREGWDKAFATMTERGDDAMLVPHSIASGWDETEWRW